MPLATSGGFIREAIDRVNISSGASGGSSPDAKAAAVTRDQWQNFLDFYRPLEDQILQQAQQTDFTAEGDKAGATAAGSINASRGSLARSLSRAGTSLSAEEQRAVGRRQQGALTKGIARAENTTRRGLKDTRGQLLGQIVGIGRGVANTATSGLNNVADLAAQREALHQQQRAQARASNIGTGASLAALAIAFI